MAKARVVVLVSGAGTNLQALLDACARDDYPAQIVGVGADRLDAEGLRRAAEAGVPTFVVQLSHFDDRSAWDAALTDLVSECEPDLVVLAGFMKLVGGQFLTRFPHRVINTHPALSPAFPGASGPRDALEYGVKVTGCTIFIVDEGVDTGPIVAQAAVAVQDGDSEETLHERIKKQERELLVETVAKLTSHTYRIEGRKVVWS